MTADITSSTEQLAALIKAKRQLAEILARLGRRQLELIDQGEMAGLVRLLAGKQTVLAQLHVLERQLDPFRKQDPERRVWQSVAARAACQVEADHCNALVAEAIDLEKQAEAAMLLRRDVTAAALASVQSAADASKAYAGFPHAIRSLQAEG